MMQEIAFRQKVFIILVKISTQIKLKYRAISANFVLFQMETAKNTLNMIILDACRNNPLPRGKWSASKHGVASVNNSTGFGKKILLMVS